MGVSVSVSFCLCLCAVRTYAIHRRSIWLRQWACASVCIWNHVFPIGEPFKSRCTVARSSAQIQRVCVHWLNNKVNNRTAKYDRVCLMLRVNCGSTVCLSLVPICCCCCFSSLRLFLFLFASFSLCSINCLERTFSCLFVASSILFVLSCEFLVCRYSWSSSFASKYFKSIDDFQFNPSNWRLQNDVTDLLGVFFSLLSIE